MQDKLEMHVCAFFTANVSLQLNQQSEEENTIVLPVWTYKFTELALAKIMHPKIDDVVCERQTHNTEGFFNYFPSPVIEIV